MFSGEGGGGGIIKNKIYTHEVNSQMYSTIYSDLWENLAYLRHTMEIF